MLSTTKKNLSYAICLSKITHMLTKMLSAYAYMDRVVREVYVRMLGRKFKVIDRDHDDWLLIQLISADGKVLVIGSA